MTEIVTKSVTMKKICRGVLPPSSGTTPMPGPIILISNEWPARALIRAQLIEEGYETQGLLSLEDALGLLKTDAVRPSLIIFDAAGYSLDSSALEPLREMSLSAPVLICVGSHQASQVDFKGLGFDLVLVRPYTIDCLVRKVRTILGGEADI